MFDGVVAAVLRFSHQANEYVRQTFPPSVRNWAMLQEFDRPARPPVGALGVACSDLQPAPFDFGSLELNRSRTKIAPLDLRRLCAIILCTTEIPKLLVSVPQ